MEKAICRILCLSFLLTSSSLFSQETYNYTGQVGYQNGNPMSGVTATLRTLDGEIVRTDTSENGGFFTFADVPAATYLITFYTDEQAGSVALDDANLILEHLNGEYEFESAIQELAADVNGNGVVNMGDYQNIVNHYLNQGIPFSIGPWVFENDTVVIPSESRDGTMKLGSSSGDVNGSLVPDPKSNPIFLENPVVSMPLEALQAIEFNLSSDETLAFTGMHLVFRIPDNLGIISVESPFEGVNYFVKDGLLKVTCMDITQQGYEIAEGRAIITIIAEEINPSADGNQYHIVLCDESHFMDINGNLFSGLSLNLPTINLVKQQNIKHSAYPNPFLGNVTIEYQLPREGMVQVVLYDQYGRQIMEIDHGFRGAGIQEVKFNGSSLVPGIYHYILSYSGQEQHVDNGIIIKSK